MKDRIIKEIEDCQQYLEVEGDNELDRPFYEGRIFALEWVLKNLPEEG
jgi:hypothetical protein